MSGVHGCLLEVTGTTFFISTILILYTVFSSLGFLLLVSVVKCKHLNQSEVQSREEFPYVCLEYGTNRYHTRTYGDGGLFFQEKLTFTLSEGLPEINISVYINSFNEDGFIGRGRVHLQRVISQGYDDTTWPIFGESGMTTGEVCLMLCCPNTKMSALSAAPYDFHLPNNYHQSNNLIPYYPPGEENNLMNMSRGLKRPLLLENYVKNEEELGRDPMRRKLTMEAEGHNLQSTEVLDTAMEEFLNTPSPEALDEDTNMGFGSHLSSDPYSRIWDTICF